MSVVISSKDGVTTVQLPDEFDAAAAESAREDIETSLGQATVKLLFDLSETHFIDSTGIGLIVYTARRAQAAGGKTALCGAQNQPLELLKILRLDRVFKFLDSTKDADQL